MDKPKNNPKDLKAFTSNEVAVLIEGLKSDFRAVVEVLEPIPDRLDKVEERLSAVEFEIQSLKTAVSTAIPDINRRLAKAGI